MLRSKHQQRDADIFVDDDQESRSIYKMRK